MKIYNIEKLLLLVDENNLRPSIQNFWHIKVASTYIEIRKSYGT